MSTTLSPAVKTWREVHLLPAESLLTCCFFSPSSAPSRVFSSSSCSRCRLLYFLTFVCVFLLSHLDLHVRAFVSPAHTLLALTNSLLVRRASVFVSLLLMVFLFVLLCSSVRSSPWFTVSHTYTQTEKEDSNENAPPRDHRL